MKKTLLFFLCLLGIPLFAQVTKVVPDCVIPFTFTAAGSTSNNTCGTPNGTPTNNGIASWILVYYNTGFSGLSLTVQSAPDNAGAPGSWGTFGGTVLTSTQFPGSSGINPNTATTSAFTGFAGYFPWMRVNLSGLTGSGTVKGTLVGFYNSTLARAAGSGGGGAGTIAGTANQITVTGAGCSGAGTCTISIPSSAIFPGTPTVQTPPAFGDISNAIPSTSFFGGCTWSSGGGMFCPGPVMSGTGSGVAGIIDMAQGTAPTAAANSVGFVAPTAIGSSQYLRFPNATFSAHSVPIIGAPSGNISDFADKVIPDCQDSAGNHLNFTQSTDAFSCGNTSSGGGGATPTITITNAGSTGTTTSTLTKLTGAPSTAVIAATSDTGHVVGITTAGAGTAGNATIQIAGLVNCVFSNATTAGDYVQISSATAGNCADTGSATYPTSGQVIGRVLSTNGSAGTFQIDLFPPEMQASSGGGGGTSLKFQYYPAGVNSTPGGIMCGGSFSGGNNLTGPTGTTFGAVNLCGLPASGADGIIASQLPSTWNGGTLTLNVDAILDSPTGNASLTPYSACVATNTSFASPTWTAAGSTVTVASGAVNGRQNRWALTVPVTGCVAGNFIYVAMHRANTDTYPNSIFLQGAALGINY